MGIRLDKPWQPLSAETVAALPGQLGVFHVDFPHSPWPKLYPAGELICSSYSIIAETLR